MIVQTEIPGQTVWGGRGGDGEQARIPQAQLEAVTGRQGGKLLCGHSNGKSDAPWKMAQGVPESSSQGCH